MFWFSSKRKSKLSVEHKQRQIDEEKRKLSVMVDKDVKSIRDVNKILSNGVTLKIYKALR